MNLELDLHLDLDLDLDLNLGQWWLSRPVWYKVECETDDIMVMSLGGAILEKIWSWIWSWALIWSCIWMWTAKP